MKKTALRLVLALAIYVPAVAGAQTNAPGSGSTLLTAPGGLTGSGTQSINSNYGSSSQFSVGANTNIGVSTSTNSTEGFAASATGKLGLSSGGSFDGSWGGTGAGAGAGSHSGSGAGAGAGAGSGTCSGDCSGSGAGAGAGAGSGSGTGTGTGGGTGSGNAQYTGGSSTIVQTIGTAGLADYSAAAGSFAASGAGAGAGAGSGGSGDTGAGSGAGAGAGAGSLSVGGVQSSGMQSMGVISGTFSNSDTGSNVVVTGLGNKTTVMLSGDSGMGSNIFAKDPAADSKLSNFSASASASGNVGTTASASSTQSNFRSEFVNVLTDAALTGAALTGAN